MNYYGSPEHMAVVRDYDKRVFSHCDFSKPSSEYSAGDGYQVRCYSAVDDDEKTRTPYRDLNTGLISRLYHKNELVYEWKFTGASPRKASIIHHANGRTYLLYYEDLYGYSVLDLSSMQSVHYIPQESHETNDSRFEETVIWVVPHYDPNSSLLAVEGCIWAAPYTVLVIDFTDPMRIIEASKWIDLGGDLDSDHYDGIDIVEWNDESLICNTGVFSKNDLFSRMAKR